MCLTILLCGTLHRSSQSVQDEASSWSQGSGDDSHLQQRTQLFVHHVSCESSFHDKNILGWSGEGDRGVVGGWEEGQGGFLGGVGGGWEE